MSNLLQPKSLSRIDAINGLRGFAVLNVIFHHSASPTILHHFGFIWLQFQGWTFVNLFFILSGFVLYKPYFLGHRSFENLDQVKWFLKHRFFRLYPLFTLNCLVCLLMLGEVNAERLTSFFFTLSGLGTFTAAHYNPLLNPVLWSLLLEIWFSVFFPILIYLIQKSSLEKVTVAIVVMSFLVRVVGIFYSDEHINPIKDSVFGRMDDFMIGMYLVKIYYTGASVKLRPLWYAFAFTCLLGAWVLWDIRFFYHLPAYVVPALNNLLQIGFAGIMLCSLQKGSLFNKLFSNRALQVCGLMCFSLYVWHILFMNSFKLPIPVSLNYLLYLVFTFVISALTYRYVEFSGVKEWRKLFLLESRPVQENETMTQPVTVLQAKGAA